MKMARIVSIFLLAFLCVSLISFAIPSRSSVGDYDPQLDINHDGKVNMVDLGTVARAYDTNGDPIVPVNVTNWPSDMSINATYILANRAGLNVSIGSATIPGNGASWNSPYVNIDGYKTYYIYVYTSWAFFSFTVLVRAGGLEVADVAVGSLLGGSYIEGPYDVKAPEIRIHAVNNGAGANVVSFALYALP